MHYAEKMLKQGDVKHELAIEDFLENDSPYAAVRAVASNVDDSNMPVNTFRTWFMGIIAIMIVPSVNQFLSYAEPWPD